MCAAAAAQWLARRAAVVCLWGVTAALAEGLNPAAEPEAALPTQVSVSTDTLADAPAQLWTPGKASWYSHRFVGKRTASGEPYRREAFSAAHRSLPLGALVTVRNPINHREVVVRINDRGPHHTGREIDLSHAAAQTLGVAHLGVAWVEWQLAPPGAQETAPLRVPKPLKAKAKPRRKAVPPAQARRG